MPIAFLLLLSSQQDSDNERHDRLKLDKSETKNQWCEELFS